MKRLLAFYEKNRNKACKAKDGKGYLYWCARCSECLEIIENKTLDSPPDKR